VSALSIRETAGELVELHCELGWVARLLDDSGDGAPAARSRGVATMAIHVESNPKPFSRTGMVALSRNAWSRGPEVVMEDVGGSGFDLHLALNGGRAEFTYRWPGRPVHTGLRVLLPSRFLLLAREVLLHYPVLWFASVHGRAPLHAVACTAGDAVALLAGPGGVGKSTLLRLELAEGASATSDNLCVADGRMVWGLVEPMRVEGGPGRRLTHGRVEVPLTGRVAHLAPDHVVVVRRGGDDAPVLRSCDPEVAVRSLVTGTYAAGELMRFWGFAATLAAGTGVGPAHALVAETAHVFATRLNCFELLLPRRPGTRLAEVLNRVEAIA
jgi:hypothetical protein